MIRLPYLCAHTCRLLARSMWFARWMTVDQLMQHPHDVTVHNVTQRGSCVVGRVSIHVCRPLAKSMLDDVSGQMI